MTVGPAPASAPAGRWLLGGLRRPTGWHRRAGRLGTHVGLALLCLLLTVPVAYAVASSLRPTAVLYDRNLLAAGPTLVHYAAALEALPLGRLLATTTFMAGSVAVSQCALAALAGFGLTHFAFRGRQLLLGVLLAATLVPQQALIMPHYLLIARTGLLGSMAGLVLPQLSSSTLAVYLFHQHLQAFPAELVDAARVDGATPRQILLRVMLPNLWSTTAAVLVIVFIQSWNEYLWPLLATTGIDDATVQVGLTVFQTEQGAAWGPLLAAAVLAALPLLLLYAVAQRHITDAFIRSGLV